MNPGAVLTAMTTRLNLTAVVTVVAGALVTVVTLAACSAPGGSTEPTAQPVSVATPVVPVVELPVPIHPTDPETLAALRTSPPQRLVITSLGLDMRVVPVGVETDGNMEIPTSSRTAGWYRHGAGPHDEQGNVVLAAHVDDATIGLGPFSTLQDIAVGATIEVVTDDATTVTYVVERVEQTSKTRVDMAVVFDAFAPASLVLVTCGGNFDWSVRSYSDNVIVWATPQGE